MPTLSRSPCPNARPDALVLSNSATKECAMGWLFMPRGSMGGHATAKSYLDDQFTYDRTQDDGSSQGLEVLASTCPGNRVYYRSEERRVGKRVSVRVDLGGRRIIKKKKKQRRNGT